MMKLYNDNIKWLRENAQRVHINKSISTFEVAYRVVASKEPDKPSLIATYKNEEISIHSQLYPEKEAEKIANSTEFESEEIVIIGMGLGYVCHKLREKYPDKRLILIEPDRQVFYLAIKHCDLAYLNFENIYVGYDDAGLPPQSREQIYLFRSQERIYGSLYTRITNVLQQKSRYNLSDEWKYKKFTSEQCRIIFIDSAYVLSKECLSAIKNTGHLVHYIHIDTDNYDYELFVRNIMKDIMSFKPDFVLTINHLGFDVEGRLTALFSEMELPFVSWFVDSPNVVLSSFDNNISDFCNIFVWDDDYIPQVKAKGYKHCDYLPLATDTEIFYPKDLDYKYTVSFVGSSMSNAIHKNMRSWVHRDDLMREFIEGSGVRWQGSGAVTQRTTEKTQSFTEIEVRGFDSREQEEDFKAAVLWKATQNYRKTGIDKLAPFMPTISGDPNWLNILPLEYEILSERWYYDTLCDFYNQSKINFNMTSLQMTHAVNQRVFDVSACRRFLLTDYRKQVEEFFVSKENMVWFNDVEEIPDLIEFYLKNESRRDKIAANAFEIVLNEHTYQHRIKKIIEVLKKRYSQQSTVNSQQSTVNSQL